MPDRFQFAESRNPDEETVRISLASSETIRSWSSGEVTELATFDHKTHRPISGGLFCEAIFGREPVVECACGRHRYNERQTIVCEHCGVELTFDTATTRRFGHIELTVPVVHLWFYRGVPSPLGLLLELSAKTIEDLLGYRAYVVLDQGDTDLDLGQALDAREHAERLERFGDRFRVGNGAEAVRELLRRLDLDELASRLRTELASAQQTERKRRLTQRIELVESLRDSDNEPEWMVLDCLPVIPAGLRPTRRRANGDVVWDDLNELYRSVLRRNQRLANLRSLNAPEVILHNEMRMLQQVVNAVFDNSSCPRPILRKRNKPFRSLTDRIREPRAVLRLSVRGKRVDYSARSVLVVGPELALHQCGLPKTMALRLYRPFVVRQLLEAGEAESVPEAERLCDVRDECVWDALEQVMIQRPVLLDRPRSLERTRLLAFEPVLVEGNAIHVHPLVARVWEVHFDGEQVAVHLPLSEPARAEALTLLLVTRNLRSPTNGTLLFEPTRDVLLGCSWLTASPEELGIDQHERERCFYDVGEVLHAWSCDKVGIRNRISVRVGFDRHLYEASPERTSSPTPMWQVSPTERRSERISTTVGRVLFDDVLPAGMPFYNMTITRPHLLRILDDCTETMGPNATASVLERLTRLGCSMLRRAGVSLGREDFRVPPTKPDLVSRAFEQVKRMDDWYDEGAVSSIERDNTVLDTWASTREEISRDALNLHSSFGPGAEPSVLYSMARAGVGSLDVFQRMTGMIGLLWGQHPSQQPEVPILSNFWEGLGVAEFHMLARAERRTAYWRMLDRGDPSYLLRKLIDALRNSVVTECDCRSAGGSIKASVELSEYHHLGLAERIRGRVATEVLTVPHTDEVLVRHGECITSEMARRIELAGIEEVSVRSPMTCQAHGVCQLCYGMDLSTGALVELGSPVGLIAAHALGELGRYFWFVGMTRENRRLPPVIELLEARRPRDAAILSRASGHVSRIVYENHGRHHFVYVQPTIDGHPPGEEVEHHITPTSLNTVVSVGDEVQIGTPLSDGPISTRDMASFRGLEIALDRLLRDLILCYRDLGPRRISSRVIDETHFEIVVARMFETPEILGISTLAKEGGFLERASRESTVGVLARAALAGEVDDLTGLQSSALVGRLAPLGTGFVNAPTNKGDEPLQS